MGISGYEAFLFITVSPIILGVGPVRRLVARYRGFFHLLSLVGVASYLKADPVWRLSLTAIGLGISLTTWCATWWEFRDHTGTLDRSIIIWGLGLLVHNVMKMAWWTENPIWPIMHKANGGINEIGIAVGVIASLEVFARDLSTPISLASSGSTSLTTPPKGSSWLLASAGFGSILFALHSMFSDSSAIMRWSVDGYPDYGPEPVPWGVATIGALALGLLLSPHRRLVTSLPWFALGCGGCAVFYAYSGWTAYYGGLVLGMVTTSLMPVLVRSLTAHGAFKTLFTSFMIYNVLCLAHVWVVAYAFVPGGVYARERTNWVLGSLMALIGCGVYNARKSEEKNQANGIAGGSKVKKVAQLHIVKDTRFLSRLSIAGILVSSILVALNRNLSAVTPAPFTSSAKSFTAAIWTIHFALDDDMWASEVRIRDALRDLELDVVGK